MNYERLQVITKNLAEIQNHTILIFGLGGVGSFAAEAIARCGFYTIFLVDQDVVEETNLNRQIVALSSTIGLPKVDVMCSRINDIDPRIKVVPYQVKATHENLSLFFEKKVDFVIEAVDDLNAKVAIAAYCHQKGIPLIAAMGFANKFDPFRIKLARANQTKVCPLAKKYRYELKKNDQLLNPTVVYSEEIPAKSSSDSASLGSTAFVPSCAGLMMASYVFNYFKESEFEK